MCMPIDPAGVSEADPFPWEAESEGEADMTEFRGMCVSCVYHLWNFPYVYIFCLYILSTLLHAPPVYTTIVGYTHYAYSTLKGVSMFLYTCHVGPKRNLQTALVSEDVFSPHPPTTTHNVSTTLTTPHHTRSTQHTNVSGSFHLTKHTILYYCSFPLTK